MLRDPHGTALARDWSTHATFPVHPDIQWNGTRIGAAVFFGRAFGTLNTLGMIAMGFGAVAIGCGLGFVVAWGIFPEVLPVRLAGVSGALLGCIALWAGFFTHARLAARRFAESVRIRGETEVSLGPWGARFENRVVCAEFEWDWVSHVVPFREGLSLCVGGDVFVVPWTAFPDAESRDDVLLKIGFWRQGAQ